jgi:transposase
MRHHGTIVVADHHKSVFVCQVLDQETGEISLASLASRRSVLRPFLEGLKGPVLVFVEACRSWEWVSDLCEDLGIELRLVDPSRMPEIARSTKKTDRHDVEAMVQRLLVTGELPQSYRASRSERELRALTRRLCDLRHTRRRLIHQVHATIDAQGLPAPKSDFGRKQWRETMRSAVSRHTWLDLECLLLQYDQNLALQELLEAEVEQLVKEREDYRRLRVIPGIGPVIAATILAESAGIERFKTARQYGAFAGLTPNVRSSAGKAKLGHITRNGPPQLRWALGQAAMVGLCSKTPTRIKAFYQRKKKRGKPGSVAVCAAAHKLARAIWVVLVRKVDFVADPKAA